MNAVEFTTELTGAAMLALPQEVSDRLPKAGMARVIVLTPETTEDFTDDDFGALAAESFRALDEEEARHA